MTEVVAVGTACGVRFPENVLDPWRVLFVASHPIG